MNLDNIFKKTENNQFSENKKDIIVSDDNEFLESMKENYIIEGYDKPVLLNKKNNVNYKSYTDRNAKNIIIDFRGSGDLIKETSDLIYYLDIRISLFVVGDIDSIKLQNEVRKLGANYIFFCGDVGGVFNAIDSFSQGKKNGFSRSAKRILILGTKGGIGVSTISCLLSRFISEKINLKTLLIEHSSVSINSDILLGIKSEKSRRNIFDIEYTEIDSAIASTYIKNSFEKLDYLSLDNSFSQYKSKPLMLIKLSEEVKDKYNFIIDSVCSEKFEELYNEYSRIKYHRVFVICEPSVSSIRTYNNIKSKFKDDNLKVVLNSNRIPKDYIMSLRQAKEKIDINDVFQINHESNIEKTIIKHGLEGLKRTKFYTSVGEIVTDLTGKNFDKKYKYSLFK